MIPATKHFQTTQDSRVMPHDFDQHVTKKTFVQKNERKSIPCSHHHPLESAIITYVMGLDWCSLKTGKSRCIKVAIELITEKRSECSKIPGTFFEGGFLSVPCLKNAQRARLPKLPFVWPAHLFGNLLRTYFGM